MKQSILISIYQVAAVALCTYLIMDNVSVDTGLWRATIYVAAAMLVLNILVIAICWKRFGHALRFRISESVLLIASAFTPLVSYYTFIADNTTLSVATSKLVLLYALGQLSWCFAIYIFCDLVDKFLTRR